MVKVHDVLSIQALNITEGYTYPGNERPPLIESDVWGQVLHPTNREGGTRLYSRGIWAQTVKWSVPSADS